MIAIQFIKLLNNTTKGTVNYINAIIINNILPITNHNNVLQTVTIKYTTLLPPFSYRGL